MWALVSYWLMNGKPFIQKREVSGRVGGQAFCLLHSQYGHWRRLGHCLFYEWDYYGAHPVEIFKIWKGGLASHGGVFAIILALMWYSKKVTRKSVWWLFDRMIPAVAIVCFCIRLVI